MSDAIVDRIAVTFSMTADDYARYFAVVNRHQPRRGNFIAFLAVFVGAIPVALAFRAIGTSLSGSTATGDLIGRASLFAFLLGGCAMLVAGYVIRRIASNRYLAGTPNAFEAKTVAFDATGVTLTGKISEARWRWAAFSRFTYENDLLLLWTGSSSAVTIPSRGFESPNACEATAAFIRARLPEVISS
ncbi:MAG TPA: YcxB family protein [Bradyrhizobium sp.]|nr:YcxB family protein [Bradyrhizobium sp.]